MLTLSEVRDGSAVSIHGYLHISWACGIAVHQQFFATQAFHRQFFAAQASPNAFIRFRLCAVGRDGFKYRHFVWRFVKVTAALSIGPSFGAHVEWLFLFCQIGIFARSFVTLPLSGCAPLSYWAESGPKSFIRSRLRLAVQATSRLATIENYGMHIETAHAHFHRRHKRLHQDFTQQLRLWLPHASGLPASTRCIAVPVVSRR